MQKYKITAIKIIYRTLVIVRIREFSQQDFTDFKDLYANKELHKGMWGSNSLTDASVRFSEILLSQEITNRKNYEFAVVIKEPSIIIGRCRTSLFEKNIWKVGLSIHPKWQEKGVGSIVFKQILNFSCDYLGAEKVVCIISPDNTRMINILKKTI